MNIAQLIQPCDSPVHGCSCKWCAECLRGKQDAVVDSALCIVKTHGRPEPVMELHERLGEYLFQEVWICNHERIQPMHAGMTAVADRDAQVAVVGNVYMSPVHTCNDHNRSSTHEDFVNWPIPVVPFFKLQMGCEVFA